LRRTSPFAGILSEPERQLVLDRLAESRADRARPLGREQREQVLRSV
jgi:hypothetical protein